jgi:hypothetical protein
MKYYALRHIPSKTLIGISVSSNGDNPEFCNAVSVEFDTHYNHTPWITNSKELIERLISDPIGWYNSGTEQPELPKHLIGKVEIIEFDIPTNIL